MVGDLDGIEIQLFLGTWCSDSQMEVPQFIKILDYIDFDKANLTMIGLERDENRVMSSPKGEEQGLNITHVPTFIFYKSGQEIGRIVEYPTVSLEVDMVNLLE
jgi:thiol-disulfide isomerase/thioredoxin